MYLYAMHCTRNTFLTGHRIDAFGKRGVNWGVKTFAFVHILRDVY